jgi:hypothetical protein
MDEHANPRVCAFSFDQCAAVLRTRIVDCIYRVYFGTDARQHVQHPA